MAVLRPRPDFVSIHTQEPQRDSEDHAIEPGYQLLTSARKSKTQLHRAQQRQEVSWYGLKVPTANIMNLSLLKGRSKRSSQAKYQQEIGLGEIFRKTKAVQMRQWSFRRSNTRHQDAVVMGGRRQDGRSLRSVEGYLLFDGRWIELPSMNTPRSYFSSVVFNNKIVVSGGDTGNSITDSIEILNLDEIPLRWRISNARLPVPLSGHQTVVYHGKLIVIGGYDGNAGRNSNKIYEILLIPPNSCRILCTLPQPRAWHGVELVQDRVFIFGGGQNPGVPNDDVFVYHLVRNQLSVMQKLPYRVQGMATVRKGNEVYLVGGVDDREQELNRVIKYHVRYGMTTELAQMNERRGGCCAVIGVTRDRTDGCSINTPIETLVVLGSLQHRNTVEGYDFHSHMWRGMPASRTARESFTTVISPINLE